MCNKVVSKEPFMLKYCLDRYKTQGMRDNAADAFLWMLKFISDWFVTNKTVEKLGDIEFSSDDTVFDNVDSDVTFFNDDMVLVNTDLYNVCLDEVNFDDDDPEAIIHARLIVQCNRYKNRKEINKR